MDFDFIAIDFETANSNLSSACSVGLVYVENNQIIDTDYYLLRPEPFAFDTANTKINGITVDMVQDALTFDKFWNIIYPKIDGNLLVAHNAIFDMSVMRRCLKVNNIPTPDINYICSIQLSSPYCPNISTKLVDRAKYFNIEILDHHNAANDARLCAELVLKIISKASAKNINDLLSMNKSIYIKKLLELKPLRSFEFRKDNINNEDIDFFDLEIINGNLEQKKRFEKAQTADITPMNIDENESSGTFKGSGKSPYISTLNECTCGDFKRRHKPCKHMYRLALELGLINADFKVGINKNEILEKINELMPETQQFLLTAIYLNIYRNVNKLFLSNKNKEYKELLSIGLAIVDLTNYEEAIDQTPISLIHNEMNLCAISNIPNLTCRKATFKTWINSLDVNKVQEHFIVLELTEQAINFKHKIYKYLNSKYAVRTDSDFI